MSILDDTPKRPEFQKILWEDSKSILYITKTRTGFTLFKNCQYYAKGFLSFTTLESAIDNAKALIESPETLKKLVW